MGGVFLMIMKVIVKTFQKNCKKNFLRKVKKKEKV